MVEIEVINKSGDEDIYFSSTSTSYFPSPHHFVTPIPQPLTNSRVLVLDKVKQLL
jgi:hypothetical protein